MSGVIVVAPPDAAWARQAEALLADSRLHTARVHDLGVVSLLLLAGGVRAVLVDHRCAGPGWPAQLDKLRRLSPRTRVTVIASGGGQPAVAGAVPWPDDAGEALELVR